MNLIKKKIFNFIDSFKTSKKCSFGNVLYDFLLGLRYWRIWYILGSKEIKLRYKRSKFGQLWHTITTAIYITFVGLIWAYLFKVPVVEFLPYLAISKILYDFISSTITNGCKYYYLEKSFILELPSPKSIYAYSNSLRNLLSFLHNIPVIIIVILLFKVSINSYIIFAVPAFFLILLNSVWITIIIGYLGARFRDIPPLLDALMGIIMMVTPIMWQIKQLPEHLHKYMLLNPFNVFIKITRDSILGIAPDPSYWLVAVGITIFGYMITFLFLRKCLNRISFWV